MSFTQKLQTMNGTDEYYTPSHAVKIILPYIPHRSTIWCPFDKPVSQYVKVFTTGGHKVICSHIEDGKDFFLYEPDEPYDCIISNPPYSKKEAVFSRLYEIGKPFGMLVNINGLFDSAYRFGLFRKHGVQLFIPQGRTKFVTSGKIAAAPPFQTCYVCWKLLPEMIVFEPEDLGMFEEC